jgi:serine/threonine protein kinase
MSDERKIVQNIVACSREMQPYKITGLQKNSCTWQKQRRLGQGNAGTVYKACCQPENCGFIVKVVENLPFDSIQNEVTMQQEFAKNNLAPKIREAFMCEDKSYIISDMKVSTLSSLLSELAGQYKDGKWDFERQPKKKRWMVGLLQQAVNLLDMAHDARLMHDDAHLDNFMTSAKEVHDEASYRKAVKSLKFIDFGYSKHLSSDPEVANQEKYDDTDRFYGAISDMPWGGKIQPLLKFRDYVPPY